MTEKWSASGRDDGERRLGRNEQEQPEDADERGQAPLIGCFPGRFEHPCPHEQVGKRARSGSAIPASVRESRRTSLSAAAIPIVKAARLWSVGGSGDRPFSLRHPDRSGGIARRLRRASAILLAPRAAILRAIGLLSHLPGGHSAYDGISASYRSQGTSWATQICAAGRSPGSSSSVATRTITRGWPGRSATRCDPHNEQKRRILPGDDSNDESLF